MTTPRRITTAVVAPVLAAALAATLTACSTGSDSSTESPAAASTSTTTSTTQDAGEHNAADAQFAQMMIVHHQGAVEMAELVVEKAATADVRALGQRIADAQGPEIELMSGWLDSWGEDQPDTMDMAGMDHGGMDMGGLDQDAAMADLEQLTGSAFDARFLELMIEHHRGAIEMAEAEQADGTNEDAIALAGRIIEAQTAEIAEMTAMAKAL